MKSLLLSLGLIFFANQSLATHIVIEPDDYADGADLTHVSPYATITTSDNHPVSAFTLPSYAADGHATQGLGKKVFGGPVGGEWFYMSGADEPFAVGLEIKFNQPVTYFSMLVAELFWDAGPGDEPIFGLVMDEHDNLLANVATIHSSEVDLGEIDPGFPEHGHWAYWKIEYSAPNISKLIIGGDSEPTTLDHLEFDVAVPEPNDFLLLLGGIFFIVFFRCITLEQERNPSRKIVHQQNYNA